MLVMFSVLSLIWFHFSAFRHLSRGGLSKPKAVFVNPERSQHPTPAPILGQLSVWRQFWLSPSGVGAWGGGGEGHGFGVGGGHGGCYTSCNAQDSPCSRQFSALNANNVNTWKALVKQQDPVVNLEEKRKDTIGALFPSVFKHFGPSIVSQLDGLHLKRCGG